MNRIKTCVLVSGAVVAAAALAGVGMASGSDRPGLVVRLVGTDVGEVRDLSHLTGAPGADEALCFDLVMLDAATGRTIGTASDCLINVQTVGDGLSLTAVTIFNFPGGTIVNEGQTTVQPTTIGSEPVTHITGAIPQAGDRTIIDGTRGFAGAEGSVRLSGAVDLSSFAATNAITFDCLFVIDLD